MITPVRELPGDGLFYSELGVFPFQADGLAEIYHFTSPEQHGGRLMVWDAGIGKSVEALLAAAFMFEDDLIDQVIVVSERNKIREWVADVERFTGMSVVRYHDSGRHRRLDRHMDKHGRPHVLATVYETGRDDLLRREKKGSRGRGTSHDGVLFEKLGLRDLRILWIFDEPIKFKNRSSEVYKAYERTLNQLRRGKHHQRIVGLSMTPMERDISQAFNVGRLFFPTLMPSVGDFEDQYTNGVDPFGRYSIKAGMKQVFAHFFQQGISRKRKTDPDVIDQFPQLVEESTKVTMEKQQRDLYNAVMTMLDPPGEEPDRRDPEQIITDEALIRTALRLTAGHPAAHTHVGNKLSKHIHAELGRERLQEIGSAKTKWLIDYLTPLVKGQGAQVIVFEFFTSVITEVARELREAGFDVVEYHGRVGERVRENHLDAFKSGRHEILFASDAAARGINLQNAQYVVEYSSATSYATRVQRINRNNRIDSKLPSTTAMTMVTEDTVEEDIFAAAIDRNQDQDTLVGDREDGTGFISAAARRELLKAYKRRRGQEKETAA